MPLGPLGGAPVQGFPPQVTGVRLLEARNETAVLDACILRYAAARSACGGAPCAECITALDAVAADCLRPSCGLGGTERGARFVANFRSYRYLSVAKQCLRSLALPHFEAVEDMSCGGAPDGSVRTAPRVPRGHGSHANRPAFSPCHAEARSTPRAAAISPPPEASLARCGVRRTSCRWAVCHTL